MRRHLTAATGLLALGLATAATLIPAEPASAQRWQGRGWQGGGWNRGGWNRGWRGGWNRGWRGGYGRGYYRPYYRDRGGIALGAGLLGLGVGAAIASANRPYYGDPYYGGGYYGNGFYSGYGDCVTRRVWDPYLGRRIRVQTCY